MSELIILRGLPGSGKSTLAKQIMRARWPNRTFHYEADMFHYDENGNYNWDATRLGEAHKWCQDQCREKLQENQAVIVSNTFTTVKELRPYFEMARDVDIVPLVYLCQNRFDNIHSVPAEAIQKMRDRFVYDLSEHFPELK